MKDRLIEAFPVCNTNAKIATMKKLFLLFLMGFAVQISFAQTDVVEFLKGGKADANNLIQAYLEPYAYALGDGLNNGWYNSAATHKLFGFDLAVTVSAIQIPEAARTFDVSKLSLTNITVESGGNIAPTIAGTNVSGPRLQVNDNQGNPISSFSTPNGLGLNLVPVPMAQLGFGLLPHTDVIGRYLPDMKYNNNGDEMKLGFWGIGVKHNFMEWIPMLKKLPFDASVFGSYSEVNAQSSLTNNSSGLGTDNIYVTFANDNNQMIRLKTMSTKYGLVVSKKLGILTVFGGIAQSTSESTVDLIGKYTVNTTVQLGGQNFTIKDDLIDPVALMFKSKKMSMDAGFRLKLAVFSLFGSINKAQYTSYTAGIGLGIR